MDIDKMKNMIVLKNLPSNIIDEAIVILKPNKKVYIPKEADKPKERNMNSNDYIINEAQMVISNYISNIENKPIKKKKTNKIKRDYKTLKIFILIMSILLLIKYLIL